MVPTIRMTKTFDESLVRPLSIIFRNSLNSCIYTSTRKEANVVLIHKKDENQCVNNYHLQSLLPVFWKHFEKLIFNEVCSIFLDISKVFDKVWHEDLLYKPKSFGNLQKFT